MSHILNKLSGVEIEAVKNQLEVDKEEHAKNGLYLEHIWTDADNADDIYFLFRVDDLEKHKQLMDQLREQLSKEDPHAQLPFKIFLADA